MRIRDAPRLNKAKELTQTDRSDFKGTRQSIKQKQFMKMGGLGGSDIWITLWDCTFLINQWCIHADALAGEDCLQGLHILLQAVLPNIRSLIVTSTNRAGKTNY